MKETKLIGGNEKELSSDDKIFPVLEKANFKNWICIYEKNYYNEAEQFYKNLYKASKSYDLEIIEPYWIEMPIKSNSKDWIDKLEYNIKNEKNNFNFIVFLIGKNPKIYFQLKTYFSFKKMYVTQFVKVDTLRKKEKK